MTSRCTRDSKSSTSATAFSFKFSIWLRASAAARCESCSFCLHEFMSECSSRSVSFVRSVRLCMTGSNDALSARMAFWSSWLSSRSTSTSRWSSLFSYSSRDFSKTSSSSSSFSSSYNRRSRCSTRCSTSLASRTATRRSSARMYARCRSIRSCLVAPSASTARDGDSLLRVAFGVVGATYLPGVRLRIAAALLAARGVRGAPDFNPFVGVSCCMSSFSVPRRASTSSASRTSTSACSSATFVSRSRVCNRLHVSASLCDLSSVSSTTRSSRSCCIVCSSFSRARTSRLTSSFCSISRSISSSIAQYLLTLLDAEDAARLIEDDDVGGTGRTEGSGAFRGGGGAGVAAAEVFTA
eukprot:PhM_4_TR18092/c1_g1_i1/m.49238